MIAQPRISNKELVELCHRLAVETESGIDIRRTWQREAEAARGRFRPYFARIRDAVARGDSLTTALAETGNIFPPLFLEMAHVGEETGTLGRVMHRLEGHYRRHVQARRVFLGAIAWPMIELGLTIMLVGILIVVMGYIRSQNGGQTIDLLGFGLYGMRGLIIYVLFLSAVGLGLAGLHLAMRRGRLWTRPLQRAMIRLPGIGPCLEKLALSRLAWALQMTMNVEMDMRRVIPLALRATGNDFYIRHTDRVVSSVLAGKPLVQALALTGAFPAAFLDTLAVGEESGQIVESMGRLADRYELEAETAVRTLATLAGAGVFVLVAAVITWLIFKIFGFYVGTINDAVKGIG
jgi:type IV pilus assembly protein PilC